MHPRIVRFAGQSLTLAAGLLLIGCSELGSSGTGFSDEMCIIPPSDIQNGGVGKDGIPALTNPPLVSFGDPGADYVRDGERVVGLVSSGGPVAVPLQILWWHEIINLELDGRALAITHCPLTGSSLVFDRSPLGGVEFGVSGLLYLNNLIMYDRRSDESLWPQMSRGARCGPRTGNDLTMVPAMEMTWAAWKVLHPDTRVLSSATGHDNTYQSYPYGLYDREDNANLLFDLPSPIDARRPPKELVLGVPGSEGGMAYPFGELESLGPVGAVRHAADSGPFGGRVVFWDGAGRAAAIYQRLVDGIELNFTVSGGSITDVETGSVWRIDGLATAGPLAGRRLEPVAESYVAFWFAWAVFEPNTVIWAAP